MAYVIEAENLKKHYVIRDKGKQKTFEAVKGLSLKVKQGEIFGFLGPNGAGKTTTMRMLTTLLSIDGGRVTIAGYDLQRQPHEVRRRIGYVSQLGGADQAATGRENLLLQGQLYGLSKKETLSRTHELTELFDLSQLIDRAVKTYSGGQKRRLEIALGLLHRPAVLFLDEPTSGLDPHNRANLWDQIRELREAGTTIFLTTHYLEEADILSDRLVILDHGQIVAEGFPDQLKQQVAGDVIKVKLEQELADFKHFVQLLESQPMIRDVQMEDEIFRLYVDEGAKDLPRIFEFFETQHLRVDSISLSQASLDDVFLKHTGRTLRDIGSNKEVI